MATLTATEQRRLGIVRPELMALLLALMDNAQAQWGYRLAVPELGGTRSTAQQAAAYQDSVTAGGGTPAYAVAKPGYSRHEYGAAFDVHIIAGGGGDGGQGTEADYQRLATLGESLRTVSPGLVAGFFFDARGVGKHDPFHFQLNETLLDSQMRWKALRRAGIAQALALGAIGAVLAFAFIRR